MEPHETYSLQLDSHSTGNQITRIKYSPQLLNKKTLVKTIFLFVCCCVFFFNSFKSDSPPPPHPHPWSGRGGEGPLIVFDIEPSGAVTACAGGALRGPNASIG